MEKKDTDTYCDSSEFKVWLYTGVESWGSCAEKEFLDWSAEVVLSLQRVGDFPWVHQANMASTTSCVAEVRTFGHCSSAAVFSSQTQGITNHHGCSAVLKLHMYSLALGSDLDFHTWP